MGPPKPALWALLLVLLGTTQGRAGLRTCSVPDVLRHYRAVIFQDLQAAARAGGLRRALPGVEAAGGGSRYTPWKRLRQQSWRPQTRPSRRRGGRRWLLLHALDTIATCWEKLFALRAAATQQGEERARLRTSLTGAQPTHRSLCSPQSP
ncbi:hypothetical protein CB1_000220027 [Camelus ferus]|nr:hypothetical protein CB1_000220027 [Camelus ferus]